MIEVRPKNIPEGLKERNQWVMWRLEARESDATKVPYSVGGGKAKANDPSTWSTFDNALAKYNAGSFSGIGFEFSCDDPFTGIDLDGCRDPKTGAISDWAVEVIAKMDTYAEVSPSGTGVKLFCKGVNPLGGGRKESIKEPPAGGKNPAIEVYSEGRYFAVTGYRGGKQCEPQDRNEELEWIKEKFFSEKSVPFKGDFHSPSAIIDRAMKYLATMPAAISGQSGHSKCFQVACVLVLGFGLSIEEAMASIGEWNARCDPPWSEREIRHKLESADKQPGDRNYLRTTTVHNQHRVRVPTYQPPPQEEPKPERKTLVSGMREFSEGLKRGNYRTISTGIRPLDDALGGGLEPGEVVVVAGRPSHGKSAIALQFVHEWTSRGEACIFFSEEMSSRRLGQRAVQFITNLPRDQWDAATDDLDKEIEQYSKSRAPCYIQENCGKVEVVVSELERAAADGVKFAVVDYAQLLKGPGKSTYDQTTNVCKALTTATRRLGVTMIMLCQLSRSIESRDIFEPKNTDLKESGQFEQDADVILFVVWPHRIDATLPREDYRLYVGKNKNRDIVKRAIECKFDAEHQRIAEEEAKWETSISMGNREPESGW